MSQQIVSLDGIRIIKLAVTKDNENNGTLQEIYDLYIQGYNLIMSSIQAFKNEDIKKSSTEKINDKYLDRITELKQELDATKKIKSHEKKEVEVTARSNNNNESDNDNMKHKQDLMDLIETTILTSVVNISWDSIKGLELAKQTLKQAVIYQHSHPQFFTEKSGWKGVLLFGCSGTGKSILAQAAATATESKFYAVKSSDLVTKLFGDSEKLITALFASARKHKSSIIFFDEIDALIPKLNGSDGGSNDTTKRMVNLLKVEMDGITKNNKLLVIGATNNPWDIDVNFLRRFEKKINIPLPEAAVRYEILKSRFDSLKYHSLGDKEIRSLAGKPTEHYSGADIDIFIKNLSNIPLTTALEATHFQKIESKDEDSNLGADGARKPQYQACKPDEAGAIAMKFDDIDPTAIAPTIITYIHALRISKIVKPSNRIGDMTRYDEWTREFGEKCI
jgi:vacuolar protein-sorting-associated protein 4